MVWPFSSTPAPQPPKTEFDDKVPPPPHGNFVVPPPEAPKGLRGTVVDSNTFSGFTPPPSADYKGPGASAAGKDKDKKGSESSSYSISSLFPAATKTTDYESENFSKYTSPTVESHGLMDDKYASKTTGTSQQGSRSDLSWIDRNVENPRVRSCLHSIGMGMKMGSMVGGVFGGLTGLYASVVHRNVLILPISVVGGAVSFGFFLGCGMLVRCEEDEAEGLEGARRVVPRMAQAPLNTQIWGDHFRNRWQPVSAWSSLDRF